MRSTRHLRRIRARIEAGTISEPLEDIIADQYRSLAKRAGTPAAPVAVRSSATAEDLPDASFAGQQDTYLWVRGVDDLLDKIRKCWSSLFTARAISYRTKMGFDHSKVLISVAVQKMVRSFTAGVMFTLNPSTGDAATVVIDSNWGYGESVVSGEVTPDQFQVNKITMEVVKRDRLRQGDLLHHGSRRPTRSKNSRSTPSDERLRAYWTPRSLSWRRMAKLIEKHYGKPMDIEWATEKSLPYKGEVFILQSRPETVWSQKEVKPVMEPKKSAIEHIVAGLIAGKKIRVVSCIEGCCQPTSLSLDEGSRGRTIVTRTGLEYARRKSTTSFS